MSSQAELPTRNGSLNRLQVGLHSGERGVDYPALNFCFDRFSSGHLGRGEERRWVGGGLKLGLIMVILNYLHFSGD